MTPCKTPAATLPPEERRCSFKEVELGYTPVQAMTEAERCMDCPEKYCMESCPAHTPVPDFIREIRKGNLEKAYEIIEEANPLADISCRVCPQSIQCESNCTRGIKSEPVAIGRLERFVRDANRERQGTDGKPEPCGKSVAVIGSGPAGLTCALELAKQGVAVTVFEKSLRLGGAMDWGIPSFVLPENLVEELITKLRALSVEFVVGVKLGRDKSLDELCEQYDAVFVATGAEKPVSPVLTSEEINGLMQAADYLEMPEKPKARRVAVFGGGNTAIDAARAAVRTGAERVQLIYRRTEEEMPATKDEVALALEEGVDLIILTSPVAALSERGQLSGIRCNKMVLTAPDYPGGRKNVAPSSESVIIEADLAILALGFENEPFMGVAHDSRGRILVDKLGRTNEDGVYAGGDAVIGASTLMKASASGRAVAKTMLINLY